MPPRKRTQPPARPATAPVTVTASRKVTRTVTVITTPAVAEAIAARAGQNAAQVPHFYDVERLAGPDDVNARWRFNIPGQMLVVSDADLPIIKAFIDEVLAEKEMQQL